MAIQIDIKSGLFAPAGEGEETAEIYRREARAVYEHDRESAAALLLDAAYANDRDENAPDVIVRDLHLAVALCPEAIWIYAAAHRLLLKLGLWQEALEFIEREIELTKSPDEQLALTLTATDLYWIVAENEVSAMTSAKRALSYDATNVSGLYAGLWLGDIQEQEVFAESLAKILGAPSERAVLYGLAGSIHASRGNKTQALECYSQAVQADKTNPYIQLRYAILNEHFGRLPEAALSYAQIAQIIENPALSGEFFKRAGIILGYAGQHDRSAYFLLEAQKRVEEKFGVTWLACEAVHRTGNAQRVTELEHQLIDMASDDASRAAHWMTIADVCLDELNAPDAAIEALEAASSLGCTEAAPILAGLYEARGDWAKHAAVLKRMIAADAQDGLGWLLGDALWRSEDQDGAIDVFTHLKGVLGLFELDCAYEATEHHEAHARMLETWLQTTKDPGSQDALMSHLLTILTERLHAPDIAMQYVKDVRMTRISRELTFRRLRLSMQLHRYEDAVSSLMQLADETEDRDEALMWSMEAALIRDRSLHDVEGAIELLLSIHETSETYMPAIVLLHHIGLRERRYKLVMRANAWRDAFLMAPSRRAQTALENARACLHLQDYEQAAAWFEKAKKFAPLDARHLRLYVELLRTLSRWPDAVQAISNSLWDEEKPAETPLEPDTDENEIIPEEEVEKDDEAFATEPQTKTLSPEQLALRDMMYDMQTFCLNHVSGICYGRQKYYERQPSISTALNWLLEKSVVEGHESLCGALNNVRVHLSGQAEEIGALIDWAEAEVIRGLCPDGADPKQAASIINLLKRSLDLHYGTCLRAEVLRTMRELPDEDVMRWLERYAQLTPDRWMSMALCREAALRAIWNDEDYDAARRVLSQSLVKDDTDLRTLWMLEHFSAVSEDWKALGYFRERLAQLEITPRARLQALKSALAPYVDDDLTEHAVRVAQECLKLDGHTISALVTLAHVAEDANDIQSLACIADRLSEASGFSENRTEYGLWAAQLWFKSLSRPEQAVASLERLLAQEPACMPAIAMSEQLFDALGRYDQLGRIYSRAIASLDEGPQQSELLRKQAQLLSEKLNDAPAACLSLTRIIKQNADDLGTLTMLSKLLTAQERWSEAVDIIEQLSRVVETPEQKRETNLKLAEILIHQIDQPERAKRILRRHLNQFEHDMKALHLLYDIATTERNWADAKTTLEEICQDETSDETRHARMAFTRVAREAGWPHELRTMYERQAIAAVIGHREDFDAMVEDYRVHNELPRLIDVAKRELGQLGNVEQIAAYRGCVAALLVANRQHREALVFLSEIIHESQHTDWAYLARAQALTSAGQLQSAVGEFRRTLTRNIHLNDALDPFVEVLKQTGDEITFASVSALRDLRRKGEISTSWERCVKGAPRGYIDIDHLALARAFVDAQRYLRTMTPYAFELFSDNLQLTPIESSHWVYSRCHRLFGQNLEIKNAYVTSGMKQTLCRARLQTEPALIFDEAILDEDEPEAFDFWAGYGMHQAVTGGCLIDVLGDSSIEALFSALCQEHPETALAQNMKRQLFKALPRAERKLFKDGVPFLAPSWSDFRRALQTRAACTAAVISACPAYSLHARPDDEALQSFLISESYVRFVKTYWTQGLGITG